MNQPKDVAIVNRKVRDIRLDILRIFALFCVIAFHFFLNSGFYDKIVIGKQMYIMCIIRSFFTVCVPLFIILTGYLLNRKILSKQYYKRIIKILIIYFICSVIYSLFAKYYLKEEMNLYIFLKKLLGYNGTRYAWYIEMYIGLFLIIPFLNIVINNLKNQKSFQLLLVTIIVLMGLPSVLNCFDFKVLPDWWMGTYPIFYYFLGAYLSRYPLKLNTKLNIILLIIFTIFDGSFNFYKSYGKNYIWESWNGYSSIFVMIESLLAFNLILKIRFKAENNMRDKFFKTLSDACLGAYLLSCAFDSIYYDKLSLLVPEVKDRFIYAPIVVLLSFTSSLLISIIINIFYKFFANMFINLKNIIYIRRKEDNENNCACIK